MKWVSVFSSCICGFWASDMPHKSERLNLCVRRVLLSWVGHAENVLYDHDCISSMQTRTSTSSNCFWSFILGRRFVLIRSVIRPFFSRCNALCPGYALERPANLSAPPTSCEPVSHFPEGVCGHRVQTVPFGAVKLDC